MTWVWRVLEAKHSERRARDFCVSVVLNLTSGYVNQSNLLEMRLVAVIELKPICLIIRNTVCLHPRGDPYLAVSLAVAALRVPLAAAVTLARIS